MTDTATAALAHAAQMAGLAPSIHNTQPWRWRVDGSTLELRADRQRQLGITDPGGRMLTVSCGTALHQAQTALAAAGWAVDIARLPDRADADLLARATVTGPIEVTAAAMRLLQSMRIRHTDRRPVSETPVPDVALAALRQAAEREGAHLHVLRRDDVVELASAAAHAQTVENLDAEWREELIYWASGGAGEGHGIPAATIPSTPPETTVPGRDFGPGSLAIGPGHDRAARYAILYGDEDTPVGWLHGGEALSAVWLEATGLDVSVLPLSAAVEVPETRRTLRRMLSDLGEPYLVLRLGIADPDHAGPPHTPRVPASQLVEIVSDPQ